MNPIMMNLIFFRSPQKPKEEGIYWCIVKGTASGPDQKLKMEYGYDFILFKNKEFQFPEIYDFSTEVVAWCELENPEQYFKQKPLIIPTM